jgi:hypothetical protein
VTRRRTPEEFAALHKVMTEQQQERRDEPRALRTGDLIQAHPGGEIREVIEHESAGMYFRRKAEERALEARTERNGNN